MKLLSSGTGASFYLITIFKLCHEEKVRGRWSAIKAFGLVEDLHRALQSLADWHEAQTWRKPQLPRCRVGMCGADGIDAILKRVKQTHAEELAEPA